MPKNLLAIIRVKELAVFKGWADYLREIKFLFNWDKFY